MTWCRFSHQYHRRQFWPTLTDMAVHFLPVKKYIQASYKLSGAELKFILDWFNLKNVGSSFSIKKGAIMHPLIFIFYKITLYLAGAGGLSEFQISR